MATEKTWATGVGDMVTKTGTGTGVPGDPWIETVSGGPIAALPSAALLSYVAISETTSGDRTIIAGTASQTIRIFRLVINYAASPLTLLIKNGASTTLMTQPLNAYGALVLGSLEDPLWALSVSNAFILNLSAGVQIYGGVWYTKS